MYGADETRNVDFYSIINLQFQNMFDCASNSSITLMFTTLNNIVLETGQSSTCTLINDKLRTH